MSDSVNTKTTWYGKPIEELTKEELIEVIEFLGEQLEVERKNHARTLRFHDLMRKIL